MTTVAPTTTTTTTSTPEAPGTTKEVCCCPEFTKERLEFFDKKKIIWEHKPFVKDSTWCFLYMPLSFGGAVRRANAKIEAAGAQLPLNEIILLSDMTSRWSTRILVSVSKDWVPGAEMVHVSGTFLTKVFEGSYSNFDKWIKDMKEYVKKEKGDDFDVDDCTKWYTYYATCPKCAKKFGKNYIVLLVKVE